MLSSLVLGALVLAPGVPLALAIGRPSRWSSAVAEGLVAGLAWWLLLGLWFSHAGWYDPWQLIVPTLAVIAAVAVPAWRAAAAVERPRPTWFAWFMAAVVVVAAALRAEPYYFLYQIGDFGEYVNRGNAVADGGSFIGWFTQGFTVALSLTHLVLGESRIVDLLPFLGLVLLVVTVELAARLGASPWARAVVAVVLAVGVAPVWFSRFPASESLYAVLQVGMILLVVVAVQRGSTRPAIAAGVVAGLLLVVRGNGILLGPIVVLAVCGCALVVRRRAMEVLTAFLASALLSLGAAFVFNARFSYPYFIAEQLPKFVPDPLFDQIEGMGRLGFAVPRLVALVAATAALVVGVRWLHTVVGPRRDGAALRAVRLGVLPGVVVLAVAALYTVLDHEGLADSLDRYNPLVLLAGGAGIAVAMWRFARDLDDEQQVAVTFVVLLVAGFSLLFAERLPEPRYAPYFLYWDRYLFSEVFPVTVLASVWVVGALERLPIPKPLFGAGALALGVVLYDGGSLSRDHTFMADAYPQLRAVDELASDDDLPILFAGVRPEEMPAAVYHPNTHRIVASPLASTFGRSFLNLGLHPYAPDPQPDGGELAAALRRAGADEAYLVQVAVGDDPAAPIDPGPLIVDLVGTTTIDVPLLDRPLVEAETRWRIPRFTVTVSRLTR